MVRENPVIDTVEDMAKQMSKKTIETPYPSQLVATSKSLAVGSHLVQRSQASLIDSGFRYRSG